MIRFRLSGRVWGRLKWALLAATMVLADTSAQEAKDVPRTISDLIVLLESATPDMADLGRRQLAAGLEMPPGLEGRSRVDFHLRKAHAAQSIGDSTRAVAEYESALRFAVPGEKYLEGNMNLPRISRELSDALAISGNFLEALKWREKSLLLLGKKLRGTMISAHGSISRYYATLGEFEASKQHLAEMERVYKALMAGRDAEMWADDWTTTRDYFRGIVAYERGLYRDAESSFRSAYERLPRVAENTRRVRAEGRDTQSEVSLARFQDSIARYLALALSQQGRHVEAEWHLREVLHRNLKDIGRFAPETAMTLSVLGVLMHGEGRFADSERLVRAAVEIYGQLGIGPSTVGYSTAIRIWVRSLVALGRFEEAIAAFDRLKSGFGSDAALARRFASEGTHMALALARVGRGRDALEGLELRIREARRLLGDDHEATALHVGMRAVVLSSLGEKAGAKRDFLASVETLLRRPMAGRTKGELLVVGWILEDYLTLLAEEGGSASVSEAFRVAEAARSNNVQRAVSLSAARSMARTPDLADLIRRDQDLENEYGALTYVLQGVFARSNRDRLPGVAASMRERLEAIESERRSMSVLIRDRFPEYSNLINPRIPGPEDVRKRLRDREVLVSVFESEARSFVWAIPKTGPIRFAVTPAGRSDLARMVGTLRRALDPYAHGLHVVPPFDTLLAHDVYRLVIAPVSEALEGADHLIVIASGALGQIPLTILPTFAVDLRGAASTTFDEYRDVPWLVRRIAVTQVPTANAMLTLRSLPARTGSPATFAGFGDPVFDPGQGAASASGQTLAAAGTQMRTRASYRSEGLDSAALRNLARLPDTADEVRGIAAILGARPEDIYLAARANEKEVKSTDLRDRRVLVFATHGLIPGDINGLTQPALALSAPEAAGIDGDGLLTMDEVLALKLDADWVVLSACNTASGDGAGAEAISGLGRAFFYAGTRALLVSNWPVETVSARLLTTGIFQRQARNPSINRASALRGTMLEMIDSGRSKSEDGIRGYSYSHPLFWAPFSLVGDGG